MVWASCRTIAGQVTRSVRPTETESPGARDTGWNGTVCGSPTLSSAPIVIIGLMSGSRTRRPTPSRVTGTGPPLWIWKPKDTSPPGRCVHRTREYAWLVGKTWAYWAAVGSVRLPLLAGGTAVQSTETAAQRGV